MVTELFKNGKMFSSFQKDNPERNRTWGNFLDDIVVTYYYIFFQNQFNVLVIKWIL